MILGHLEKWIGPDFLEADWFKLSGYWGSLGELKIIVCLHFCWRNMAAGSE
jgi:hypothetical protein